MPRGRYVAWYQVFKGAAHDRRNSIVSCLDEAMLDRIAATLELLPRAAQMLGAWAPLWHGAVLAGGSNASDGAPALALSHNASFTFYADEVMRALGCTRGGHGQQPAAPPAGRVVLDTALVSILFVSAAEAATPTGGIGAIVSGAMLKRVEHGSQSIELVDGLSVSSMKDHSMLASWWDDSVGVDVPPHWSDVHLISEDQLAISYILPIPPPQPGGAPAPSGTPPVGYLVCTLPLRALQSAFLGVGSGSVQVGGFVMQRAPSRSGFHTGALIASRAGDEETRHEVGGSWFTTRRQPAQSSDISARAAAAAVLRDFRHPNRSAHYDPSNVAPRIIGVREGDIPQNLPRTIENLKASRIYRTFGAPRTYATSILDERCTDTNEAVADARYAVAESAHDTTSAGPGASSGGLRQAGASGDGTDHWSSRKSVPFTCGLDWTAVILVDWQAFFSDWYNEKNLSLLIFCIFFALQLHVVQVLIHSSFRHVDKEAAARDDDEELTPTHHKATEELCAGSTRTSINTTTSTGTSRIERYRQIISDEVARAQKVPWRRFLLLTALQGWLIKLLEKLPLDKLPRLQRSYQHLQRGEESAQQIRHRRAIRYIRLAQRHTNILTVCTLRQGKRFVALQAYLVQSSWLYRVLVQSVASFHAILQAFEPTPHQLKEGRGDGQTCPIRIGDTIISLSLLCLLFESFDVFTAWWISRTERAVGRGRSSRIGNAVRQSVFRSSQQEADDLKTDRSLLDGDNMLQSRVEAIRREMRMVLLFGLILEWCLLAGGCTRILTDYIPIRPIYVGMCSAGLTNTVSTIVSTLFTRSMRSVVVNILITWLIASLFAMTVLRSQVRHLARSPTPSVAFSRLLSPSLAFSRLLSPSLAFSSLLSPSLTPPRR